MASTCSSSSRQLKHQVFLSFRGEDTRHSFTNHLHKALEDKGLNVFFDEKTLEKGEEISPALLKGIAASDISIIILSVDYASSKSCLAELSEIMFRRSTKGHIVIPIFYRVEPSNVRKLGGSFKASFNEHESKTKRPVDDVKRWKEAFSEVGRLTGFHIKGERYEAECIKEIVEDIIKKLNKKFGSGSGDFVGIGDQKKAILNLIQQEDTRIVGIWGMGGIGKTTLAEAVYNEVSPKFAVSFFLYNVRDKVEKRGIESLRNEFLSNLLKQKIRIDTPSIGSPILQQRLNNKRIFVVLDDVNDSDQVDCLGVQHFGHGSKTLITSRHKQVLKNGGANKIHEVKKLNEADSLQLFSKHAFKQSEPVADLWDLSNKFLKYSQGNPLALKVLGSNLYQRPRKVWESARDKLNECPESKIMEVLKISFYGLDELEKNIFLDVACFFNREEETSVVKILSCCYNGAIYGIKNLVDKCLLDSNVDQEIPHSGGFELISMHDLLQEMGRDIVRNEYKNDPKKCRRLWSPNDVYQVLKYNKGTESIEGIMLDMSQIDALQLCPTVFKKMINLRVLKFYFPSYYEKPCNKGLLTSEVDCVFLPEELRYLRWDYYPFKSLSSNFNLKNLVELRLEHGNMEQLWNGDHQDLINLRQIVLIDCKNLRKIPNLLGAINLERLKLYRCKSLVELLCLRDLVNLRDIVIGYCKHLRKIPNLSGAINLESFDCAGCESLVELSCLRDLVNLRKIVIGYCKNLRKIPNLSGAINLESFDCVGCESLVELPCLRDLVNLRKIVIGYCKNLRKIPNLSGAINLESFDCVGFESLVEFPCLRDLVNLRDIDIGYCKNLRKIPNLSGAINLESFSCAACENLVELPCLRDLINLRQILIQDCKNLKKIPNLSGAIKLEILSCEGCESLVELPCFQDLVNLKEVLLSGCKNLRKVPDLSGLINLKTLHCLECENLIELPCLTRLTSLEELRVERCRKLNNFPDVPNTCPRLILENTAMEEVPDSIEHLLKLVALYMANSRVKNVSSNISKLESLSFLDLSYCSIAKFPEIPSHISELYLSGTEIEEVPSSIGCLNELWKLDMRGSSIPNLRCNIDLSGCLKTEDVPSSISRFKSLTGLKLNHCKNLKLLLELPSHLRYLDAHDCTSLEKVSFTDQYLCYDHPLIYQETINFSNCIKLNQDSIDNIVANAMLRIESLAKLSSGNKYAYCKQNVFFCLPENEILTKKFESQSMNSSIVLKINPNSCSGSRFLVFTLCLVLDLKHCPKDCSIKFICEYQLKATGGDYENFKSEWVWVTRHFEPETKFLDDHVFILFSGDMVKKDGDYEEASFDFYVETHYWSDLIGEGHKVDDIKVEKCGVHVFYVDADSSADIDVETSEKFNSDEMSNAESDENSDSKEDANIEKVHDDSATKMKLGHKRSSRDDSEEEGGPKRLKYSNSF